MITQIAIFLLFIIFILSICLIILQSINKIGGKIGGMSPLLKKYGGSMDEVKNKVDELIGAYTANESVLTETKIEKDNLTEQLDALIIMEKQRDAANKQLKSNTQELELYKIQIEAYEKQIAEQHETNNMAEEEIQAKAFQDIEKLTREKNKIEVENKSLIEELAKNSEKIKKFTKTQPKTILQSLKFDASELKQSNASKLKQSISLIGPEHIKKIGTKYEVIDFSEENKDLSIQIQTLQLEITDKDKKILEITKQMTILELEIHRLKLDLILKIEEIKNEDTIKATIIENIDKALHRKSSEQQKYKYN